MKTALQHIQVKIKMTASTVKHVEERNENSQDHKNNIKEELKRPRKKMIDKKTGKERLIGKIGAPEAKR